MKIFITVEKITGLSEDIVLTEESNEINILWSENLSQMVFLSLRTFPTIREEIILNHYMINFENLFFSQTVTLNTSISSHILQLSKDSTKIVTAKFSDNTDFLLSKVDSLDTTFSEQILLAREYTDSKLQEGKTYTDTEIVKVDEKLNNLAFPLKPNEFYEIVDHVNSDVSVEISNNKLLFLYNSLEEIKGEKYHDFLESSTVTFETMSTINTSLSSEQSNSLIPPDEIEPFYINLKESTDVKISNNTFCAVRSAEFKCNQQLIFSDFKKNNFRIEINSEDYDSEYFVNVSFSNNKIYVASPNLKSDEVEVSGGGDTTKTQTSCFRIFFNDNPIVAIPLTTTTVTSLPTVSNIDKLSINFNANSFYFGTKNEKNLINNFLDSDGIYDWNSLKEGDFSLNLDEVRQDQIYQLYLTNANPKVENLADEVVIDLGTSNNRSEFKLRLILNIGVAGKKVTFKTFSFLVAGNYVYTSYITATNNAIEIVDCIVRKQVQFLSIAAYDIEIPRVLKDVDYYDWLLGTGLTSRLAIVSLKNKTSPLKDEQYAAFSVNRPIAVNLNLGKKETLLIQNVSFNYLRGRYLFDKSKNFYSSAYAKNCIINININDFNDEDWVILDLRNVKINTIPPLLNDKMFPLTTTTPPSSTNRKLEDYMDGCEPLMIFVNGQLIFRKTGWLSAEEKRNIINWRNKIVKIGSRLYISNYTGNTSYAFTQFLNTENEQEITVDAGKSAVMKYRRSATTEYRIYVDNVFFKMKPHAEYPEDKFTFKLIYSAFNQNPEEYYNVFDPNAGLEIPPTGAFIESALRERRNHNRETKILSTSGIFLSPSVSIQKFRYINFNFLENPVSTSSISYPNIFKVTDNFVQNLELTSDEYLVVEFTFEKKMASGRDAFNIDIDYRIEKENL